MGNTYGLLLYSRRQKHARSDFGQWPVQGLAQPLRCFASLNVSIVPWYPSCIPFAMFIHNAACGNFVAVNEPRWICPCRRPVGTRLIPARSGQAAVRWMAVPCLLGTCGVLAFSAGSPHCAKTIAIIILKTVTEQNHGCTCAKSHNVCAQVNISRPVPWFRRLGKSSPPLGLLREINVHVGTLTWIKLRAFGLLPHRSSYISISLASPLDTCSIIHPHHGTCCLYIPLSSSLSTSHVKRLSTCSRPAAFCYISRSVPGISSRLHPGCILPVWTPPHPT